MTADELCQRARETMVQRGKTYDPSGEAERSMPRIVAMFNAACEKDLTETEGWIFMQCLKIVRGSVTPGHEDSALDGVAYAALAGESALRETDQRPALEKLRQIRKNQPKVSSKEAYRQVEQQRGESARPRPVLPQVREART